MRFREALFVVLLLVGAIAAPTRAEDAPATRPTIKHQLIRPGKIAAGERYPLVVYLHGAGDKGADNERPLRNRLPRLLTSPAGREKHPCFLLVPQCPAGSQADGRVNNWVNWDGQKDKPSTEWANADSKPSAPMAALSALIDDVVKAEPIDPDRVYVAGVSMGGAGTWYLARMTPDRFAAIITVCGLSEPAGAERLKDLPAWVFHGEKDANVPVARSRDLTAAVAKAGGRMKYTEFAGAGHGIDGQIWTDETLDWLFAQRRPKPATQPAR